MDSLPILLAHRGSSLLVTLNRPKALNALTLEMVTLLRGVVRHHTPTSVILRGEGGRAFCAGGDVRSIWDKRGSVGEQVDFFREEYFTDFALARHAHSVCPHVALWEGVVMGGGVGISIHAPFRVATPKTLFAMPETAIGIFPDVGGSLVLPRLPLGPWWGLFLGMTGARLQGADVVHGGLATHFLPEQGIPQLVEDLCALEGSGSSSGGGGGGGSASSSPPPPMSSSFTSSSYASRHEAVNGVVRKHATPTPTLPPFTYSPEALAALARAFDPAGGGVGRVMERLREEVNKGGQGGKMAGEAASLLSKMSPTSLEAAFEAQVRGSAPGSTLGGTLAMELRLIRNMVADVRGDFYEGVRSVLVDKGKGAPPAWGKAVDGEGLRALFVGGGAVEGEKLLTDLGMHTLPPPTHPKIKAAMVGGGWGGVDAPPPSKK